MTNRLELNWKLDGFVDEQRYYCSETPINTNNLPSPKAILSAEARSHIDANIEAGKIYYVRIGSFKNEVEKLSSEISIRTTVDGPRRIAIITDTLATNYLNSIKNMFDSWGHITSIIAESRLTIEDARNYDLLVGVRTSVTASNVILQAFNEGIPVLCSNYAGTVVNTTTWAIKLRLLSQLSTSPSSDNYMYKFNDHANIFFKAGITLPDDQQPYLSPNYSTYSIGEIAPSAKSLAYRVLESEKSIVIAEKGGGNLDNQPFPAKIAYVGILFTNLTDTSKSVINEIIKFLTR